MTQRQAIEEAGFEALQRLYVIALRDSGQCRFVARFLLGLYNGLRFPFDLTDLRGLDQAIFEDCMAALRMDARLTAREVHTYFEDGHNKFEELAKRWGVEDMMRVREDAKRAAQPVGTPAPVHDGGYFDARVKTYGDAPGYRHISLVLGLGENENTQIEVRLDPSDSVDVMMHIAHVHAFCWRSGRGPLDAREGEQRPRWLDRTPAEQAGYPSPSPAV
ncbi:DUF7673 family protein [Xenophilus azovorans]|uniref:DUF7673 family protein n=1 Tax=Xenophilus azovorans TaxID=151755 RepID=UPI000A043990|nr:hypothetical protein [Xenophilus azovorans]